MATHRPIVPIRERGVYFPPRPRDRDKELDDALAMAVVAIVIYPFWLVYVGAKKVWDSL